ncbi:MFS transporter [Streptomyces sp. NPDC056835]|uniref:MFS transporter n=1 Tax=Streptomyces sp. NPDC056835 TaxID=3345956 RepID=UPI0036A41197
MSSYAAVLRTPHAARAFGAALLGRLSYGTVPLSLVLAVKDASGSFAVAGTAMALFSATSVLLSPARAALIDRYGPRRALVPMAALYAVLLAVLAFVTREPAGQGGAGTSGALLGVLAALAGACTPPLGPTMRTLWGQLLPDRRMLQRAYSLDGVAEELLFVAGPLLVGVLVAYADPAAGVAAGAVLVLVGTVGLALSPIPFPVRTAESGPVRRKDGRKRAPGSGPRGLRQPVLAAAGVGLCLGGLDLLAIAFTEEQHRPGAVAWVLAALSAGSAVGGLANGAISWRSAARTRLAVICAALGVSLAAAGLAPNVYALGAAAAVAGLFVAPALTTAYLIADEAAAPGARTRAGAWVNTAVNAGSSGGTALIGLLVGRLPLALCFVIVAVPALLCAAMAPRTPRTTNRPAEVAGRHAGDRAGEASESAQPSQASQRSPSS